MASTLPEYYVVGVVRVAGGVADIFISPVEFADTEPPVFEPGLVAGDTALDINGHTALTFNSLVDPYTIRVNTGGGTIVGQPWTLSRQPRWVRNPLVFPATDLIV